MRIGKTGVITPQFFRNAPNDHPRECPTDSAPSRGDGAFGRRRSPVQSRGGACVRRLCQDRQPLDRAVQGRGRRGDAGPVFATEGDPDPDRLGRWRSASSRTAASGPGGRHIAELVGASCATVSRILKRAGLSWVKDLLPAEPVLRYEYKKPGGLIHLDIRRLGRFDRVGHRITGDRTGQSDSHGAGWDRAGERHRFK